MARTVLIGRTEPMRAREGFCAGKAVGGRFEIIVKGIERFLRGMNMEIPRSEEYFKGMIQQMLEETAVYRRNIEENGQKRLAVEEAINDVKMLQDKAHHIVRCNEKKGERYREEMKKVRETYLTLTRPLGVQTDGMAEVLQGDIDELREAKDRLKIEFDKMKESSSANVDQDNQLLQELQAKLNELQQCREKLLTKLNQLKTVEKEYNVN